MAKVKDELNKGHEIKGVASFMDFFGEIKTIEIKCTKENLMDGVWLFNNIPWINHSNEFAKIKFDEVTTLHMVDMNDDIELKTVDFNNILASAMHGFFGNSYSFDFMLDDKVVYHINDTNTFAFSKDDVKRNVIENQELKIKGLTYQLNKENEILNKLKGL